MTVVVLLRVLLAPTLVVASSLAGRRWGPRLAGTLVTLPIVAGPILLIIALEQGTAFAARAASAALLGLVSLALFITVFAWLSRRFGWVSTLALAWAATVALDLLLAGLHVNHWWALFAALLAAWAADRWMPTVAAEDLLEQPSWPWWDLPGRAVATGGLVLALTGTAAVLGPTVTGVLAPFPIATSVVASFALAQHGSPAAVSLLRGVPRGLVGFAAFCFVVAIAVEPAGTAVAFLLALLAALALSARPPRR